MSRTEDLEGMVQSLRALLTGSLDYAGLFPPAELPLSDAIRAYSRQRRDPHAWIQSRFICPVGKLPELDAFRSLLEEGDPIPLSVLLRGGSAPSMFVQTFGEDLDRLQAAMAAHEGRLLVDALETKLPNELTTSGCTDSTLTFLDRVSEQAGARRASGFVLWLEAGFEGMWRFALPKAWEAFRLFRERPDSPLSVGFKLRCGGVTAAAFPSPEEVAFVIAGCRDARVPLKFTAGLHHPVRRHHESVHATMHGFLNVFVAGVLARAHALDAPALQAVLEEQDPRAFSFTGDALAWKDRRATLADVEGARTHGVLSFGSCSFEEPRDELKELGLL
jgi:hypothetical protein